MDKLKAKRRSDIVIKSVLLVALTIATIGILAYASTLAMAESGPSKHPFAAGSDAAMGQSAILAR